MIELSLMQYFFGFFGAFIAGFIDAIIGGGGLITLPLILSFGIPPALALSTNKFQAVMSAITALFSLRKHIQFKPLLAGIVCTALASLCGSFSVLYLPNHYLKPIILCCLLFVLLFSIFKPSFGNISRKKLCKTNTFLIIFGLILGFYDGFMGPGTGSFWIFAFILFLGLDIKNASMNTKVLNTTSNLAALIFFMLFYKVLFTLGIIMGIGGILGAMLGAKYLIHAKITHIKIIFYIIVSLIFIKLLIDAI